MGLVLLSVTIGLILLVTALGGSRLTRQMVMMMIARLMGATLIAIAIWFWLRPA
jgi:hypothetical protein